MQIHHIQLLIKRQFREQAKLYKMASLVLIAVLALMFLIIHQWRDSFAGAVQNGVFIIGLFISGGLFSNYMFHEFSSTSSSIWFLSLPVKHSEKLISSLILSVPFFITIYIILFYVVDLSYLFLSNTWKSTPLLNLFEDGFSQFFFWYFSFNAVILWGVLAFKNTLLSKLY